MVKSRARLLRSLKVGDIFHAASERQPVLICLVTSVDGQHIYSRVLTTQQIFIFNIDTGLEYDLLNETGTKGGSDCVITSVEPLPLEIHHRLIHFDRSCRLAIAKETRPLTEEEKHALLFVDEHFANNPLP